MYSFRTDSSLKAAAKSHANGESTTMLASTSKVTLPNLSARRGFFGDRKYRTQKTPKRATRTAWMAFTCRSPSVLHCPGDAQLNQAHPHDHEGDHPTDGGAESQVSEFEGHPVQV